MLPLETCTLLLSFAFSNGCDHAVHHWKSQKLFLIFLICRRHSILPRVTRLVIARGCRSSKLGNMFKICWMMGCQMPLRSLQFFQRNLQRAFSGFPDKGHPFVPVSKAIGYALAPKLISYRLIFVLKVLVLWLYNNDQYGGCAPVKTDEASLICSLTPLL